ncbi:MAG: PAS domain-containing protein, partial [Alphaproteobacteria bacterium]
MLLMRRFLGFGRLIGPISKIMPWAPLRLGLAGGKLDHSHWEEQFFLVACPILLGLTIPLSLAWPLEENQPEGMMESVVPLQHLGSSRRNKDRFVVFAFASAELLVETDLRGRISFAEGAFRARFGRAPQSFIGQPVISLVAP